MAELLAAANLDLLLVVAVCISAAFRSWRTRPQAASYALTAFLLAVATWALAHLLGHLEPSNPLFARLRWLGAGSVAFVWFVFVLQYVGRDELVNRWSVGLLLAWPALLNLLVWLPEVAAAVGLVAGGSVAAGLEEGTGVLFLTHVVLSYGLLAAGTVLLLVASWQARTVMRRDGMALLVGVGALWAGSAFAALEPFDGLHVHYLPAGLALAGAAFLWATTRGGLLDLLPAVSAAVLETMDTGVIVTDVDGRIVELNRAARDLFDLSERERVVGKPLADVITSSAVAPGPNRLRDEDGADDSVTVTLGDRVVRVTPSTIRTDRGEVGGDVYLCEDVTGQFIQQSELKRKNERLKEFARIVSNDLRNPLDVAQGRLELAREAVANDHLDHVARAQGRMEVLIDDLLTLAREGEEVTALEPVELAEAVKACWAQLDAAKATMVVQTNQRIRADGGRLELLLENLLQNAIRHGGEDVTISVGALEDGFYVEDDGPGIPPDGRERVFESGYSTTDGGTGFGLAIVERVADAHGWEVTVTGGDGGGARFEFTGVDVES